MIAGWMCIQQLFHAFESLPRIRSLYMASSVLIYHLNRMSEDPQDRAIEKASIRPCNASFDKNGCKSLSDRITSLFSLSFHDVTWQES
jgi:hypothetical protein